MKHGSTAVFDGPAAPSKKRLALPCRHVRVERGSCLDTCLDCGAVAAPGGSTFYATQEER